LKDAQTWLKIMLFYPERKDKFGVDAQGKDRAAGFLPFIFRLSA
jgi:hypothetical protein